jgi:hypothetical protein
MGNQTDFKGLVEYLRTNGLLSDCSPEYDSLILRAATKINFIIHIDEKYGDEVYFTGYDKKHEDKLMFLGYALRADEVGRDRYKHQRAIRLYWD